MLVTLMCGVAIVFFFAKQDNPVVQDPLDTVEPIVVQDTDDMEYYNQTADWYLSILPEDKVVVARLIDSVNHYIIYFEKTEHPSCYCYDLESMTTSVIFGGESGFYIGTKLLIIGRILDWIREGDMVTFVAENRAPESTFSESIVVFSLNIYTHLLLTSE